MGVGVTPMERAEKIHSFICGCHFEDKCLAFIESEIREAVEEATEEALKVKSCAECFDEGWTACREAACHLIEGDVLLTSDEFEGKTKLKVFDLIERIFKGVRALQPPTEKTK